ncbi:MAG: ParA family protein [Caldilineaceae bacterium]|jgi:chromosome partitioning protein
MAHIIGFVSQKGGVGKSTLARLIAREYAANGWNVKIADLDPGQGTSFKWHNRRMTSQIDPDIAVERFRTVDKALPFADHYDLFIFDGPAHSNAGTLAIAKASHLLVLPTGLSVDDMEPAVLLAHELVGQGIPQDKIVFAFCRVGESDTELAESQSYVVKAGYTPLSASLPERTAYRRATDEGKALSECTFPTLKKRADDVAQAIIDQLTVVTSNPSERSVANG